MDLDRKDGPANASFLTSKESERAGWLKDRTSRRRMARRFSLSRLVLSRVAGVPPDRIGFVYGVCGKPRAVPMTAGRGAGGEMSFNISHSENVLAVAVAFGAEIGVDIEVVDRARGTADFYYRWTRQEAVSKLTGVGLAYRGRKAIPASAQVRSLREKFAGRNIVLAVAVAEPSSSPDPYQGIVPEDFAAL